MDLVIGDDDTHAHARMKQTSQNYNICHDGIDIFRCKCLYFLGKKETLWTTRFEKRLICLLQLLVEMH